MEVLSGKADAEFHTGAAYPKAAEWFSVSGDQRFSRGDNQRKTEVRYDVYARYA